MGSKLLFIILLAVSLHRLSAAPVPAMAVPSPNHTTPYVIFYDLTKGGNAHLHTNIYGSQAHSELGSIPEIPSYEGLSEDVKTLATNNFNWNRAPHLRPPVLSKESYHRWDEHGGKYYNLSEKQKEEYENWCNKELTKGDKNNSRHSDWSQKHFNPNKPPWWDHKFIYNNFDNDEYQRLIALGDLLKFGEESKEGEAIFPDGYINDTFYPELAKILPGDKENLSKLESLTKTLRGSYTLLYEERISKLGNPNFKTTNPGRSLLEVVQRKSRPPAPPPRKKRRGKGNSTEETSSSTRNKPFFLWHLLQFW